MNLDAISEGLNDAVANFDINTFIYDFLKVYDFPKSTITILQQNPTRLSKRDNVVILKNKILYHILQEDEDLHIVIDKYQHENSKHKPRFVIVTDGETFLAADLKTNESLDIPLEKLPHHFSFFLPLIGIEKTQYENENPADVKASSKMAKLYDEIIRINPDLFANNSHDLNVFLSRLLFCYFAEDTNIFSETENNLFLNSIGSHTQQDGSDLQKHFTVLFKVLNTKESERGDIDAHFDKYPYVNGGLFEQEIKIPQFNKKTRDLIIECGNLDWAKINPDIFGSMIQAVVHPGHREHLGMHYTSIPNIMKVIQPLFLNDLESELDKAGTNIKKLEKLRERIKDIRIFDPACGSGNFLIVSYKKLCELELDIIERIRSQGGNTVPISAVTLDNFYGIEIDDFAHEIAQLSLWIAQYQINEKFYDALGMMKPMLPLSESGNIVHDNAARIEWSDVCPRQDGQGNDLETYILGNPPYYGSNRQKEEQKKDMSKVLGSLKKFKKLDYICIWFFKASQYIQSTSVNIAFVSTNSITQGEQVDIFWPSIFNMGIEISFAHTSFKWNNLAKGNAGVSVVVIGLTKNPTTRIIYNGESYKSVKDINPYLAPTQYTPVRQKQNSFLDCKSFERCGYIDKSDQLMLNEQDFRDISLNESYGKNYIKKLIGAEEMLKNIHKYCIWVEDPRDVKSPIIRERIKLTAEKRNSEKNAHRFARKPNSFTTALVVPRVSSENRNYIPISFFDNQYRFNDSVVFMLNPEIFHFGVVSSWMHMLWVKAIGGRLEDRIRYSSSLCYNTFPFPKTTDQQKKMIENQVYNILDERERHPDKTMAELYDPELMPNGLKQAHAYLDEVIEKIYRAKPFKNNEERLAHLFDLYSQMIDNEE